MSTNYFILTKSLDKQIDNDDDNQIIYINNKYSFILPQTNIEYYLKHGLFEKYLMEWSKKFCSKDKNVLDIGAHTGTYSLCFSNYCKTVYSFEPQKMTYYALCGSVALSNIKNINCYNFGLGSEEQVGTQQLKIVSNDGGGSTLHAKSNILREEQIRINTLDSLNLENIGFIKMDVEDNELFVLQGGVETLKRSNYPSILFESNYKNDTLFNFIKTLGYNIEQIQNYNNMYLAKK